VQNLNKMNLITALEIASNYPNGNILIEAAQHKETSKWTSLMYMLRDGNIHKLMLSFDISEQFAGFDSKEEAISKMEEVAQAAIKYVNDKGALANER
jgi:hypothetical protein